MLYENQEIHRYKPHSWHKLFDSTGTTSISSQLSLPVAREFMDRERMHKQQQQEMIATNSSVEQMELASRERSPECQRRWDIIMEGCNSPGAAEGEILQAVGEWLQIRCSGAHFGALDGVDESVLSLSAPAVAFPSDRSKSQPKQSRRGSLADNRLRDDIEKVFKRHQEESLLTKTL